MPMIGTDIRDTCGGRASCKTARDDGKHARETCGTARAGSRGSCQTAIVSRSITEFGKHNYVNVIVERSAFDMLAIQYHAVCAVTMAVFTSREIT